MVILALKVTNLSIPAFIEKCRKILAAMTGNANFTNPNPKLTDITTAINTLETTYQLGLGGDHNAKRLQKEQRALANQLMMQLKTYVENTAGDNLDMAQSSGIEPRKKNERHSSIAAPENVRAFPNGSPGTGHVMWKGVKNRTGYQVYQTTDLADITNPDKWTLIGTTGQRFYDVSGLASGTKYAFCVVAVGTRNVQSGPSDPAVMMAA